MAQHGEPRLATLTVLGARPVRHVLFADRPITVGRRADCTVVLDVDGVEPLHARLWCRGEHWILTEAPGNDTVRVNGQPVEDALLSAGDTLAIGPVKLRFDGWLGDPTPTSPAATAAEPSAAAPDYERLAPTLMATGFGRVGVGSPASAQSQTAAQPAPSPTASAAARAARPVILLAFADAHGEADALYLRNLVREQHTVSECLRDVERTYGCRVVCEGNVTARRLFDLLDRFDEQIVALHYGGHGTPDALMVEDDDGQLVPMWAAGLLRRLSRLPRLALAFFNGCSTIGLLGEGRWSGRGYMVATQQAIRDRVACDFARRFYTALAWGSDVESAFDRARDASEARFRDPDEAWRMLRPAASNPSPWPWRLLRPATSGGPVAGAEEPWGLAVLANVADRDDAGRIVVDAVIQRRDVPDELRLEVIVRNVGQRLVTLSGVRVMPFIRRTPPDGARSSGARSTGVSTAGRPPTVRVQLPADPQPSRPARPSQSAAEAGPRPAMPDLTMAPMPGAAGGASGAALAADSIYRADDADAHVDDEGTWVIPVARYVPAGDFDNFLLVLPQDGSWAEAGVTVLYDRRRRAVSPLVELRG